MAIILTPSNPFSARTSSPQENFDSHSLPDVLDVQKKRADKLLEASMPVIGKSNCYYGQIKLETLFSKLKEYSSDIEISGKTAFHIGGKELSLQAAKKLNCATLPFKPEPLRDIDIRIFVKKLDQYDSFIDFLHSLFPRKEKSQIVNDLILASHIDKESISFTFGDENSLSCDVLFVFNPSRLHLFYRDAFRYSMKDNRFVSDLKNPLDSLSDYYHNVVRTDQPHMINKKGWPKLIVLKAKGAHIPDPSLEEVLFDNVVNSKKRKALVPEIIHLLTKASKKADIDFEALLFEAAEVLEKKLSSADLSSVFSKTNGRIKDALAKGIPFKTIKAYLQLAGKKGGKPDLECLFNTPFKKELEAIFNKGPLDEKLAPFLFQQKNPRAAWHKIKSKPLAESFFKFLIENDPILAKEALDEFKLPFKVQVFEALLKGGHFNEADTLYDEIDDAKHLETLSIGLIKLDPSIAAFERYYERAEGVVSIAFAKACLEAFPLCDLFDLSSKLLPLCEKDLIEKLSPYFENIEISRLSACSHLLKKIGIKKLAVKEIENPRQKEWRKLIEHLEDEDIEPLFKALLEKVSLNEARLFCLHPRVSSYFGQSERVQAIAKKADLSHKSLYWDILDLCLSYHHEEAARLILLSRGNTSGLPKTTIKKINDESHHLIEAALDPFSLAECLNDLNIEPLNLVSKAIPLRFDSLSLLKGGWLGKEPFDLEVSCYFVRHARFEMFYPLIAHRLHPLSPILEIIDSLILEKKFGFLVHLTSNLNAPIILTKLRGLPLKERIILLKKYGSESEWKIYLDEKPKNEEEIYSFLLGRPFSEEIKAHCLEHSAARWEYYFSHPEELGQEEAFRRILFIKGLFKNKPYADLKRLKNGLNGLDPSIEKAWENRQFIEEPYDLERTLKQTPDAETLRLFADKIYKARPGKEDYARILPWLIQANKEQILEIQLYFDPEKIAQDILLIRPDRVLFERLFLRLIEQKEARFLKDIFIQFNKELRDKYRRLFIMEAIYDLDSQEIALREFKDIPAQDRDFELNFICELFGEKSPLSHCPFLHFYSIWLKASQLIHERSRLRSALMPACKFEWGDEEEIVKGHIALLSHRAIKKFAQHDLKPKKTEAAHVCKAELVPVLKAIERKFDHELILIEISSQLKKLIPYHNLLTGDLDQAIFDFASLVPPSLENLQHKELCKELIACMEANLYDAHYPSTSLTIKLLIEGFCSNKVELNEIAFNLLEISPKVLHTPEKTDVARRFNELEKKFNLHIEAIFKAYKKLTEFDTFHTYTRAWLIISNIQNSLIKLNRIDWILRFYVQAFVKLPKYAFCEIRENFYLIILIKGLISDLIRLGSQHPDYPILTRLVPEYIDALLKTLEACPEHTKQSFIADIMSLTLQYSNVKIKLIFDRLIDYVEKIIEHTFRHAGIVQIEMFTQGISEALTQFVKEPNVNEFEKERLKGCMNKLKKALEADAHYHSLQNLILHWSLHEKTLTIIKP